MKYGKELILDLHECNISYFNRTSIENYFVSLCKLIEMERGTLHFWDYAGYPEEYEDAPDHLKGISAIQFIKTSNITLHSLDAMKRLYLNVFSCKDFDSDIVKKFTEEYFDGQTINVVEVDRI